MEDSDLPCRARGRELMLEPGRLPVVDRVRVEEEELDIAERARVVRPRHPEQPQLVTAARDLVVVVPEHARDREPVTPGPAERARPVRVEAPGALRVVVVSQR